MKILKKHLEEAILQISGQEGLKIYKILKGKEDINEFEIASKLKLTINQIRNVLYKFEKDNLLTNVRKKDRKKGWYIYFWTLHTPKLKDLVVKLKKQRLERLENLLNLEENSEFYICSNKCSRCELNDALEVGYVCPECGLVLNPEKRKKTSKIKKEIIELKKELIKK